MRIAALLLVIGCSKPGQTCKPHANLQVLRVDEEADLMAQIFKHVGADAAGKPTDPAAAAANIKADIDQWKDQQGRSHIDYFVSAPDRAALETYLAALDLKPAADHAFAYQNANGRWRTYYVKTENGLDPAHIASAHLLTKTEAHGTESRGVVLALDDQGKAAFATTTQNATGHKLAIVVDGDVLNAPIMAGAINGGALWVTTRTEAEAEALLHKLGC